MRARGMVAWWHGGMVAWWHGGLACQGDHSDCLWLITSGSVELSMVMDATETMRLYGQPDVELSRSVTVMRTLVEANALFGQVMARATAGQLLARRLA
jgi:hypothetical protein